MKNASRERRRHEILDAAVDVLSERGYRDASMLEVARRASASKETLYAWFGDKRSLFEAVVRRNAQTVQAVLSRHLEEDAPAERGLVEFGAALLDLLLGESAVAVNRAAVSEAPSDLTLAKILAGAGRDATLPLLIRFLERQQARGVVVLDAPAQAAEDFIGLLLGDIQLRRLLGLLPAPKKAHNRARALHATRAFLRLYAP